MPFEEFHPPRGRRGRPVPPFVTISSRGQLRLSPAAYQALGAPKRVRFLFDHDSGQAALAPAEPGDRLSYSVYHRPPGEHAVITCRSALTWAGIEITSSRRCSATMQDGMLTFFVREKKNRRPDEPDGGL